VALPDSSATAEERHDEYGSANDDERQSGQTGWISGGSIGQLFEFGRIILGEYT